MALDKHSAFISTGRTIHSIRHLLPLFICAAGAFAQGPPQIAWKSAVQADQVETSASNQSRSVTAVAYSANGLMVASAGPGQTVELRNAVDGSVLAVLKGHTGSINSIAFSPNSALLASAGSDHAVKVWDTTTYSLVRTISAHDSAVRSVRFSPDGSVIASGSEAPEQLVKLWNTVTGELTLTLTGSVGSVTSLAFAPDGQSMASGGEGGIGRLWNLSTGSIMASYFAPSANSMSVAFSPDSQRLVAGWSGKVLVFDAMMGALLETIDAHTKDGTVVSYAPDGQHVLSANPDGSLSIWNTSDWSLAQRYNEETDASGAGVTSISYSADGRRFVYGRGDATIVSALTGTTFSSVLAATGAAAQTDRNAASDAKQADASDPLAQIAAVGPAAVSVIPAAGTTASQTFNFTFSNPNGAANFGVLNILVNRALDGRNACYLAYVPASLTSGTLLLINDAGAAGGPYQVLPIPSTGSINNSQCTINGTGSSVSGSGNNMTLTFAMTFSAGFAGNKVMYMAARDNAAGNSGWQALGVWRVPGSTPTGPFVDGVTPARNNTASQNYAFTFTHTAGFANLFVLNVLVNNAVDGRNACYLAYLPANATSGTLLLVNDAGAAGGPFQSMPIPGSGTIQNSQCTVSGVGASSTASGNNLTLTLPMTYSQSFSGNRVIYAAARTSTATSDWQSVGTVTVPGAPNLITVTGGSPQTTTINTPFASPLIATVTDANNNPVGGVTVTFGAPVSGASGAFAGGGNTAITNNSGVATSPQFTANGIAGAYNVSASVPSITPVNFSLVNTSGGSGVINVSNVTVGKDLQASVLITLNPQSPTGGVTLTIQSSDPNKVLVGSGSGVGTGTLSATIPESTAVASTFVQALQATGTATLTFSAPGYANSTATITLAPSGFVVAGPNGVGAAFNTFQGVTTPLTVTAGRLDSSGIFAISQQLRGGYSTNVPISSSVPGVGTVSSASVPFAGGDDAVSVDFVAGSTTGSTNVVVAAPSGFNTPTTGSSVSATVQQSGFVAFSKTVGRNLQVATNVSLTGVAAADVPVTITSSNPAKVKFSLTSIDPGTTSIVVTIPMGHSTSSDFYIQAFDNVGPVAYTISAPGFGTVNGNVALANAGLLIESPGGRGAVSFQSPVSFGAANIIAHTGRIDSGSNFVEEELVVPGAGISVTVVSSNTSVATISTSPITVTGGSSSAVTLLQPTTAGQTTVTVSATQFTSAQVTATFTNSNLFINSIQGVGKNLQQSSAVILPGPAGPSGVAVTVTSNSANILLSESDVTAGSSSIVLTVPSGSNNASFYVQALTDTGSGTYTATASGVGPATGTATFGKSGIVILPATISASLAAGTATPSVYTILLNSSNNPLTPQSPRGGAPVTVSVNSSNQTVGTVPASVTIQPGTTNTALPVTLLSTGTTNVGVTQPSGFTTPSGFTSTVITVGP